MTTPFPFVANTVLNASQLNAITTLPISAQTANYTLVVGDVGKRVQMTNAGSTTITVNTSIFAAGDTIWIQNMGAGTCTITAGTATVGTASSLALAQYGGGTLVFQSASAATFFSQQSASYGVATGGTSSSITVSSVNYTLLTFTSDGTLTVTKAGLFDVLMFGGGAGGQKYDSGSGAGGGAGGIVTTTVYLPATTHAIDIGAGGTFGNLTSSTTASFGAPSSIGSIPNAYVTAVGGFGLCSQTDGSGQGLIGCGNGTTFSAVNNGINNVQGFKGGSGPGANTSAGGGGGTTAVGGNGVSTTGGAGGAGSDVSAFISGSALYKGGGGGGGGSVTGGAGGSSVGGAGGAVSSAGSAAAANTAGGGGGGAGAANGGSGGSGIVYIRFKV